MDSTQLPHCPQVPTTAALLHQRRKRRRAALPGTGHLFLPLHLHPLVHEAEQSTRSPSPSPSDLACTRQSKVLAEFAAMALQLQAPSLLLRAPETPSGRPELRSAFCAPLPAPARRLGARAATPAARITMRFGVASKQAYICRDCGYIYNDRTPFEKLPDNYFCPVCGAPKRRFRPYQPAVAKNANSTDVRKARKEQLKKEENTGQALPIGIAVGILALVGLYFYLNSVY